LRYCANPVDGNYTSTWAACRCLDTLAGAVQKQISQEKEKACVLSLNCDKEKLPYRKNNVSKVL
jgi:hypothetical protein